MHGTNTQLGSRQKRERSQSVSRLCWWDEHVCVKWGWMLHSPSFPESMPSKFVIPPQIHLIGATPRLPAAPRGKDPIDGCMYPGEDRMLSDSADSKPIKRCWDGWSPWQWPPLNAPQSCHIKKLHQKHTCILIVPAWIFYLSFHEHNGE